MKLSELHRLVNLYYDPSKPHRDQDVVVVIKTPHTTVGAHPSVKIKSARPGFDWDAGQFQLMPEENLQRHDVDYAEQYRELEKKYGWLAYENRGLKAEIKRLKEKQA